MAMLPALLNAGENALRKTGTSALANLIGNEVIGATGKALAANTAKNLGTQIAVNAINKASTPITVNTLGKATQYRGVSANSMQDLLGIIESSKNSAPATYTGGQTYGNGAYFFNNPEDAKNWAVAHQPGEYKAVLSIDRPLGSYLDYGTYRKNRSDFISRLDAPGSQINQIADAAFNKYMDKNGVTGYVGNNYEGRNPVYVVKNPEAMKNLSVSSIYTPDTKDWTAVEGDLQNFVKQNNLETYLGSPENQASSDMMTLYRGLSQKYDPNYPVARLDTSGYESWTDNPELAKQYGDYVYSIDVPKADIKSSYLDENPNSPTYGDRNPIYSIDKKAGLNGVSGNEYLLEAGSDYQKGLKYNEYQSPKIQYSKVDNQLSPQQQEFFKNSVIRDENGQLLPVYHSTPSEFTVFDNARLGENTGYDNTAFGHFVTTDKDFSSKFGDIRETGTPGRTMELYANVEKPIIHPYQAGLKYPEDQLDDIVKNYLIATDNQEGLEALIELASEDGRSLYDAYMDQFFYGDDPLEGAANERKALEANGYDAVEFVEGAKRDLINSGDDTTPVSSYAIFDGKNLKSVDNLNPTGNPDIRYSKGDTGGFSSFDDSIERIGSSDLPAIDKSTLPEGWDTLEKYLGGVDKRVENAIGKAKSKITKKDLVQFLEENDYDSEGTFSELWQRAKDAVDDMTMEELNYAGGGSAADIIQMRQRPDMNNIEDVYMGNKGNTSRLDREYSDRLGISRSTTPMSDKLSQPLEYAQGDYGAGVIGLDRTWSSGEAGVSNVAHERFHAWQDKSRGFDYPEEFKKAFEELEDEIIPLLHSEDEISKYWNGRNTKYYADRNEQEARMVQDYLEYKNFTKRYTGGRRKYEYDERIIKPFDEFFGKLRKLSKEGKALPAIAALFGIGAMAGQKDDYVDNIE